MDSLVFHNCAPDEGVDTAMMDFIVSQRVKEIDDMVEAQVAAMKSHMGLDLRGQTYVRPGKGLSYDPDDPLVAYNAKVQVEIEWNIFHSSLYKRALKIQELLLKGELNQLEQEKQAIEQTIILQKLSARHQYYGKLLTLLNNHADNLTLLAETQAYLLRNGKISSDDLLKLINEKAEIDRQLIAIRADSIINQLPIRPEATCITVLDTAALLGHIRMEHHDLKRFMLRRDLLETQRQNIDYLQTMDILPFTRFSYYNRDNVHNTHNVDIGVTFKIPLTDETSRQRKALKAEQDVVRRQQDVATVQIEREILLILRELDNYNDNIKGEFERMRQLKGYLSMRINSYDNVSGEYSRIDRLQEYDAYLQAWERMISYAYQRDCKLIDLQSYVMDCPISQFLVFTNLK